MQNTTQKQAVTMQLQLQEGKIKLEKRNLQNVAR